MPGLKITVIDENIPETGDESVDEMLEVDDIANAAGDEPQEIAESDESEHDAAGHEEAAEQIEEADVAAQPQGSKYTHSRIEEFCHTGGVKDFVDYLSKGEAVSAIWRITGEDTYVEETQALAMAVNCTRRRLREIVPSISPCGGPNGYDTTMRSFVNVVETPGGGTHVDGYLLGLTKQIRKAIEDNARKLKVNLKDSNMKVERDDILAGLVAVVTVRIAEPQFQGQTKDVLGTAQVKPIVSKMTDRQFGEMITGSKRGYKEQSGRVLEKIVGEMHARIQARKTKEVTRRKNALESASMPPKLSDCQPGNDDVAELFIVEGDSALGTAKAARNSGFQALLPIRGKILNVQKASLSQMLSNKECAAIIQVVGAGSGASFDIEQARYNKVIMMTDADVDGAHIRILLLTLFYRYMRRSSSTVTCMRPCLRCTASP